LDRERPGAVETEASVALYKLARKQLSVTGFQEELVWQIARDLQEFGESDLLREAAWVILCTGFRESIVRSIFPFISVCFCEWESASLICKNADLCRATALTAFRNVRKIEAIIKTARYVCDTGFERYKTEIIQSPVLALRRLPYIGEITAYHLAKNLGADVAKPDRHLVRFAASQGFGDVHSLCLAISNATGDPLRLVDLVLWRFLAETNRRGKCGTSASGRLGEQAT
jgi:hypothetical protein